MSAQPQPRRWTVPDPATPQGEITIAGWDFGGSGPIALLHHANGLCGATWGPVAERLAERFHVIAIDARGHGDSDPRTVPDGYRWSYFVHDLIEVAMQLLRGHDQPHIDYGIGSSLGGIITAAAEAARPGLFKRIAMLDPPIHPTPELLHHLGLPMAGRSAGDADGNSGADSGVFAVDLSDDRRRQLVMTTRRRKRIWPSRAAAREGWRTKPMFATWQPRALELYLQHGMRDLPDGSVALKCHPDLEAHIFATTGELDALEFAPKVHAPVLLAHAANGHFSMAFFQALITLFPNGTLVDLDAGHLLPLEAPDLTMQALLDFADATRRP